MERFDYQDARDGASELINFFGAEGSFFRTSQGVIDPITGESRQIESITINGIITPVIDFESSEINGTSILNSDGIVYFHGQLIQIGDTTTQSGITYRVVAISDKITSVDGINVYQELQVRR